MNNYTFRMMLAGAIALAAMPVLAVESKVATETGGDLATTTQVVKDHALDGELTILSRQNGEIAGVIFASRKNAQVAAFPKASIDAINKAVPAHTDPTPLAEPIVNIVWVRDLPGGGSIYTASAGPAAVGFVLVQPNGDVEVKQIGRDS